MFLHPANDNIQTAPVRLSVAGLMPRISLDKPLNILPTTSATPTGVASIPTTTTVPTSTMTAANTPPPIYTTFLPQPQPGDTADTAAYRGIINQFNYILSEIKNGNIKTVSGKGAPYDGVYLTSNNDPTGKTPIVSYVKEQTGLIQADVAADVASQVRSVANSIFAALPGSMNIAGIDFSNPIFWLVGVGLLIAIFFRKSL